MSRTLRGHPRDTFWTLRSPGPEGPRETPRRTLPRTPPVFGDTLGDTPGTLRARRAREAPVAGRGGRKVWVSVTFGDFGIRARSPGLSGTESAILNRELGDSELCESKVALRH